MKTRNVYVALTVFMVNIPIAFLLYAVGQYILSLIVMGTGMLIIWGIYLDKLDF